MTPANIQSKIMNKPRCSVEQLIRFNESCTLMKKQQGGNLQKHQVLVFKEVTIVFVIEDFTKWKLALDLVSKL